jgi:hypothetical protein
MTMKVHVDQYSMLSLDFGSKSLHMQNLGIELSLMRHELSVQIFACYTCPGIAEDDSIRIEHRYYEEVYYSP